MKIEKTKKEKNLKAKDKSTKSFAEVKEKVEKYGKLTLTFDAKDFKKKLSNPGGWGFQDMKKVNQLLITECIKDYSVKFNAPENGGMGVTVVVKKRKEE